MMQRVNLEPAYVLHRRPYSNTSLLLDVFTATYGRMSALARSARGLSSRYRGKLELFYPMLISWSGRSELKTLGTVEFSNTPIILDGDALLCGFYLNEMLLRLLEKDDPYPQLFHLYHDTLQQLSCQQDQRQILRLFEKKLLHELGYGLTFTHELQSGHDIYAEKFYQYIPNRGFTHCEPNVRDETIFAGSSLLALHHENFANSAELNDAKRLMRLVFKRHLGDKPLKTRTLLT